MSKLIIDLKRSTSGKKRWRCPQCNELGGGDSYEISKKRQDGSLFSLTMCVECLNKRLFKKVDLERMK